MQFGKMTIGDLLKDRANFSPHTEALIGSNKRYTYQQYNEIVNRMAHVFLAQGMQKGDRVAVLASTDSHFPILYMAIAKTGAITVPLNWRTKPTEIQWVLEDSQPKFLLYEDLYTSIVEQLKVDSSVQFIQTVENNDFTLKLKESLQAMPSTEPDVEVDADQPVVITYTSGTTGKPKGVMITHQNIVTAGVKDGAAFNLHFRDRLLLITPLFHSSGTAVLGYQPLLGATYILMPNFQFLSFIELVEKERATHTFLVPSLLKIMYSILLETDHDLSTLKEIISAGSTVPGELIEKYNSLGYRILQAYASSESLTITHWTYEMGIEHCHTVGKPYITELKIVDPDTKEELPLGGVGEIAISSPMVFKGYWNNPEETARVLRDGWFFSGDAGKIDEDGFLHIVDRYKDVINFSGGEKIFPAQVENVIQQLEEVAEVAVVGMKDPLWGEVPRAYVVKKPDAFGLTEEFVLNYVHQHLSAYKLKDVKFIDSLPRNSLGKVVKPQLRALEM